MSEFKLTTPIVFLIFNRPDVTERVFAEIARSKPPKLLVVCDGARASRAGEAEKVSATRAIIERVDWPCEVLTNFSDVNLGCRRRISSGLNWVFEQVEEAIILEDDCLPTPTFFRFCQELLELYRNDMRIGMISGNNFQFGRRYNNDSYYFSKHTHIWGWATWGNRWREGYDDKMSKWPMILDGGRLGDLILDENELSYWKKIFNRMYSGKDNSWAFPWTYSNWIQGWLTILPSVNLVSNIGFMPTATHSTTATKLSAMDVQDLNFPLTHPIFRMRNIEADKTSFWVFRDTIFIRIINKIKLYGIHFMVKLARKTS
jgi:hypothetical protein